MKFFKYIKKSILLNNTRIFEILQELELDVARNLQFIRSGTELKFVYFESLAHSVQ